MHHPAFQRLWLGLSILDRYEPRLVMGFDNLARAALIAAIPSLYAPGSLQIWHVFVLALPALHEDGNAIRRLVMPMKNPSHSGDMIRTEILEALGLNVSEAAEILQVRHATSFRSFARQGRADAGDGPAHGKAFGPDLNHLLRMQLAYDVAKTRELARDISIKRYVPA